jgi:adenine nucleotide transporter 17
MLFSIAVANASPLITLSTRAQVEVKKVHASQLEAVKRILEREGISGLYTGLRSALFGIGVTNGVYYYFYETAKEVIDKARKNRVGPMTTAESMLAGLMAGSATVFATNPIWVVNTRVTARKDAVEANPNAPPVPHKSLGTLATLKALIRDEGVGALWAGVAPALVLVINPIIQYTIFEQLRIIIEKRRKLTPWDAFLLGAIGKLAATGSTYPYITLKARMQLRQSGNKDEQYTNMFAGLQKIIRDEGVAGLYKGVGPKVVQSVLTAALLFGFKEQLFVTAKRLMATVGSKPIAPVAARA